MSDNPIINFNTAKQVLATVAKELNKQELKKPLTIYDALNVIFKVESELITSYHKQALINKS